MDPRVGRRVVVAIVLVVALQLFWVAPASANHSVTWGLGSDCSNLATESSTPVGSDVTLTACVTLGGEPLPGHRIVATIAGPTQTANAEIVTDDQGIARRVLRPSASGRYRITLADADGAIPGEVFINATPAATTTTAAAVPTATTTNPASTSSTSSTSATSSTTSVASTTVPAASTTIPSTEPVAASGSSSSWAAWLALLLLLAIALLVLWWFLRTRAAQPAGTGEGGDADDDPRDEPPPVLYGEEITVTTCDWVCVFIDAVSGKETVLRPAAPGRVPCCRYEIKISTLVHEWSEEPNYRDTDRWTTRYEVDDTSIMEELGKGEIIGALQSAITGGSFDADDSVRLIASAREGTLNHTYGVNAVATAVVRGESDFHKAGEDVRRTLAGWGIPIERRPVTKSASAEIREETNIRIDLRSQCGPPTAHVFEAKGDGRLSLRPSTSCTAHDGLCRKEMAPTTEATCRVSGDLRYDLNGTPSRAAVSGTPGGVSLSVSEVSVGPFAVTASVDEGAHNNDEAVTLVPNGPHIRNTVEGSSFRVDVESHLKSSSAVTWAPTAVMGPDCTSTGRVAVRHHVMVDGRTDFVGPSKHGCGCGADFCNPCRPALQLRVGRPPEEVDTAPAHDPTGELQRPGTEEELGSDAQIVVDGVTWYLWRPTPPATGRVSWRLDHEDAIAASADPSDPVPPPAPVRRETDTTTTRR